MVEESNVEVDQIEGAAEPASGPYFIDPGAAEASRRSLSVLIASRQCYMCQQGFDEEQIVGSDPLLFTDQISAHCSGEQDYLLPDTPMKEAIFRVFLAHGNQPMDADQISAYLGDKWAMTPFPRSTAPEVVQRLLDSSPYYCIAPVP